MGRPLGSKNKPKVPVVAAAVPTASPVVPPAQPVVTPDAPPKRGPGRPPRPVVPIEAVEPVATPAAPVPKVQAPTTAAPAELDALWTLAKQKNSGAYRVCTDSSKDSEEAKSKFIGFVTEAFLS